jgi:ankyrin repeat protein
MMLGQLHSYAAWGDLEGVRRDLARGVAVDGVDPTTGYTPLMLAAESPRAGLEVLAALIEAGAEVNLEYRHPYGSHAWALGLAAKAGSEEKGRFLLNAGARADVQSPAGYTPLIDAMYTVRSPEAVVRLLLAAGADPNPVTGYGESALACAVYLGWYEAARLVLEAGADPGVLQWTPLMHAIAFGTTAEVTAAVEAGSDLTLADRAGWTPFLLAAHVGEVSKARILLAAGANPLVRDARCDTPALTLAVRRDRAEMAAWLLGWGAAVDAADEFGDTALMQAAERGAAGCVRLLLAAGGDLHRQDHVHEQAVNKAATPEVLRLLVGAGADIDFIGGQGDTILHSAAGHGDVPLAACALELGAKPQLESATIQPLHTAVQGDQVEIVRMLLAAGADPNVRDVDEWTPLMYVQSIRVAEALLEAGADPTCRDTIRQHAEDHTRNAETARFLAEARKRYASAWWRRLRR